MHSAPVPADGGRDDSQPGTPPGPDRDPPGAGDAWEPVITCLDPMTEEERQAWLDALDEPFDPEEYPDPDVRGLRVRVIEETGRGGAVTEHPNVELARRGYDAFAKGDLATLTELIADDATWHALGVGHT